MNALFRFICLFFLVGTLLFGGRLSACSCGGFPSFCEDAIYMPMFVGEVISHQAGQYDGVDYEYFTTVRVLQSISGEVFPDTLSLVNQNGVNCNASIYGQAMGDSVVVSLALAPITAWPSELTNVPSYPTYDLFGCGTYHLIVHDGFIGGGNTNTIRLTDFIDDPQNNCPILNSTSETTALSLVKVGPNPVTEEVRIVNLSEETVHVSVHTIVGQPIAKIRLKAKQAGEISMNDLPAGVYILRQQAEHAEQSILLVKG